MSEYERMVANRTPNPEMRNCGFCGSRTAVGQKCCSWKYLRVGATHPKPHGRKFERGTNQGQKAKPQKSLTGWPKILALHAKEGQ